MAFMSYTTGRTAEMSMMRILPGLIVGLVLITDTVVAQPPPTLDMLVHHLASTDNALQARARQVLPRMGAEAAWKMLPLLEDERQQVYWAALRVLEDICHEVMTRDAGEQDYVARALFTLLEPGGTDALKRVGLRLLPLVVHDDHDLSLVTQLLEDDTLREHARAALSDMRTENALAALCNALDTADTAFRVDLLRTIFLFSAETATDAVGPLLDDPSPAVRAAALRALAATGDSDLLPHARRICSEADEESAFEAWDGWLRLADALAARGGHWETAMNAYREILAQAPYTLVRGGAMTGMGRFGDETAVPVIMDALDGDGGDTLEAAALAAFREMSGHAEHLALRDAFENAGLTMRIGLLALYGDMAEPLFLDCIRAQVSADEPAIREAALAALRKTRFPEAADFFAEILVETAMAADGDEDRLVMAAESLYDMALHLERQGDAAGAGRAYLAVYRYAVNEEMRQSALDGVRRFPTPDAYDIVLDALDAGDFDMLPVGTMMGVAMNAIEGGREQEGRRILDDLIPRLRTTNEVGAAINAMSPHGPNPEFARAVGIVNRWHMVGPFPWRPATGFSETIINEPNISLEDDYEVNGERAAWRPVATDHPTGFFDLCGVHGMLENVTAFAYTQVKVGAETEAQLRIGTDDGVRVWLNGALVHENDVDRGYTLDEDIVPVVLQDGCNAILLQITQLLGGWGMGMRITHPDGAPLDFGFCE